MTNNEKSNVKLRTAKHDLRQRATCAWVWKTQNHTFGITRNIVCLWVGPSFEPELWESNTLKQLPGKDKGIENTAQTNFLHFKGGIAMHIRVEGEGTDAIERQLKGDFLKVGLEQFDVNASAHLRKCCKRKEGSKKRHIWRHFLRKLSGVSLKEAFWILWLWWKGAITSCFLREVDKEIMKLRTVYSTMCYIK